VTAAPAEVDSGYFPPMADSRPGPVNAPAGRGTPATSEPERWQGAVARRSAESRATVPDVDYEVTVEADAAIALAKELGCGLTALVVRACALALRDHPIANGAYRDGRFERYDRINVGVLIATHEAYLIPTLFDADTKSPSELGKELSALTDRAEAGQLLAPELSGATFTVSDLGPLGVERSTPLIVPPQAAAVATGSIQSRAVVRNGAIVPAYAMTLTLACDHRILYGAAAAAFLMSIKNQLQEATL
jgi:pyruvate dehydrogenase E2 component (dihydrolipoamide acetyltransferase)